MSKIDKVINHFRNLREEGIPTMNTGTPNGAPGFSAAADAGGPNSGKDMPLGKLDGRSAFVKRLSPHFRELFNKTKKKKNKY